MALLVPDVGEVCALDDWLSTTTPEAQTLTCYSSNTTPAEGDTAATYTLQTTNGFSALSLVRATWNAASTAAGTTSKTYPQQTFTASGAGATIYGYVIRKASAGTLLWAEKTFTSGQAFAASDVLRITPYIEAA
jgi:hypothetical protein